MTTPTMTPGPEAEQIVYVLTKTPVDKGETVAWLIDHARAIAKVREIVEVLRDIVGRIPGNDDIAARACALLREIEGDA